MSIDIGEMTAAIREIADYYRAEIEAERVDMTDVEATGGHIYHCWQTLLDFAEVSA